MDNLPLGATSHATEIVDIAVITASSESSGWVYTTRNHSRFIQARVGANQSLATFLAERGLGRLAKAVRSSLPESYFPISTSEVELLRQRHQGARSALTECFDRALR